MGIKSLKIIMDWSNKLNYLKISTLTLKNEGFNCPNVSKNNKKIRIFIVQL